eukprot:45775-Amorphochlora_amoeboformis.AAC.2
MRLVSAPTTLLMRGVPPSGQVPSPCAKYDINTHKYVDEKFKFLEREEPGDAMQACLIAGFMNILGAVTLGYGVSDTIQKGVAEVSHDDMYYFIMWFELKSLIVGYKLKMLGL